MELVVEGSPERVLNFIVFDNDMPVYSLSTFQPKAMEALTKITDKYDINEIDVCGPSRYINKITTEFAASNIPIKTIKVDI